MDDSETRPLPTKKESEPSDRADLTERDDVLVARSTNGDKEAYRQLVEKYQSKVLGLAYEVVRNREDAEDIAQETFVKAFLSLGGFKGQSSFYTWLYRIAYNMSVDFKRKLNRRGGLHVEFKDTLRSSSGRSDSELGTESLQDSIAASAEGPQDALIRKETAAKLRDVFKELSDEHRTVMSLREIDGLSYEEIAEITGIPKGTVMSRLHYARKTMQKSLAEFAPPGGPVSDTETDSGTVGNETVNAPKSKKGVSMNFAKVVHGEGK